MHPPALLEHPQGGADGCAGAAVWPAERFL